MGVRRGRGVVGAALLVLVLSACAEQQRASLEGDSAPSPSPRSALALAETPGLGLTPGEVLADDVVAVGESWLRAQFVRDCMQEAGFDLSVELSMPEPVVVDVARALGVAAADAGDAATRLGGAAAENRRVVASLSLERRDAYYRALDGASAQDIALERGPGDGGCEAAARAAIGSLWEVRDLVLVAEVSERKRLKTQDPYLDTLRTYRSCMREQGVSTVSRPDEVAGRIGQEDGARARAADDLCRPPVDAADAAITADARRTAVEARGDRLRSVLERTRVRFTAFTSEPGLRDHLAASFS